MREKVEWFLEVHSPEAYTSREIAKAMKTSSGNVSSTLSQDLHRMRVVHIENKYRFDVDKEVSNEPYRPKKQRGSNKRGKKNMALAVKKGKEVQKRPYIRRATNAHVMTDGQFAKMVWNDGEMVVLVTDTRDIIKGKILKE